jgi:outer membrane protein TolC
VRIRDGILLAALLPLTGCMVGPDYHRPDVPVSPAWGEAAAANATSGPAATTLSEWWLALHDPLLDRLVARAVEANLVCRKPRRASAPLDRCARWPRPTFCRR